MARFSYTAVALDGRSLTGEADAADVAGVAAELGARGLILVEAKRQSAGGSGGFLSGRQDPRAVTEFLAELSMMLRSGLTIDDALQLAGEDLKPGLARVIKQVRAEVMGGASFVQALDTRREVFPAEVVAMARVAEATGRLDQVLAVVAAQRKRTHGLADKVTAALRYPAFLLVAATGVLFFFMLHVVPQFAGLIGESGSNAPGFVVEVLAFSKTMSDNQELITGGLAVILALGLLASRVKEIRTAFLRGATRLPGVAGIWTLRRAALFCSNLGTLLGQGVPLTETLKVLESVVGEDGRASVAAVGDEVRRGGRLNEALARENLLPEMAVRMIRIGEETGELATVAAEAGALYEKKLADRLDRVGALAGPIAILVIAVVIGGLMVTIMSALMSVNQLVL
jgi:general secretion pathway protein F